MPSPVSRRALLAAAGALASGCGRLHPLAARRFLIFVPYINASQARSFSNSTHGSVEAVPGVTHQPTQGTVVLGGDAAQVAIAGRPAPQWQLAGVLPFERPAVGRFAPLDAALRAANLPADALLAGSLAAFAGARGNHYAVPGYVGPWAVQYDPQVYTEAGLQQPAPDWTIDDFENDCAVIASVIAGGKLSRLRAVLPPLVGTYSVLPPPGVTYKGSPGTQTGQFRDSGLWGAFVEGFGGTVASGGRFDLTNSGAVAGLQRIVDIAARYGASGPAQSVPRWEGSAVWHPATSTGWGPSGAFDLTSTPTYAMIFAPTAQLRGMYGTPLEARGWQWARFPTLPVRSVVPIQVTGLTVSAVGKSGSFPAGGAPPGAPAASLSALAQFAVWWYRQYEANPGLIGLPAPALAAAAVQHAYWDAPGQPPGYPAVGDWQNFAVVQAGWPLVPGRSPAGPAPVFDALTQAVTQRVPISTLLPHVTQQLNDMLVATTVAGAASGSA